MTPTPTLLAPLFALALMLPGAALAAPEKAAIFGIELNDPGVVASREASAARES